MSVAKPRRRSRGGRGAGRGTDRGAGRETDREAGSRDPRAVAVRLMTRLESGGGSLASLLPPAIERLSPEDARRVRAWCHELARHHHRLDALVSRLLAKPLKAKDRDLHWLLELGLLQAFDARDGQGERTGDEVRDGVRDGARDAAAPIVDASVNAVAALGKDWARGLVNGVLRRALREREALLAGLDAPARLSHPEWLLRRLAHDWPDAWEALARANDERAPMTIRVAGDRDAYLARLAAAGIGARPGARAATALVLDAPVDVHRLPGFDAGEASVQDESAQLAAAILAGVAPPGARLLDACAAPGGKTAHALQTERFGEVVALDVDPARLERVADTLRRIGRPDGARLVAADAAASASADPAGPAAWWDGRPFDAILLDAPCSGTGVVRRHPDIKLLRRDADVEALAALQARLLDALWPLLAPGGHLLYATCSVLKGENERQVTRFLGRTADASSAPLPAAAGAPRPLGDAGGGSGRGSDGDAPGAQILTGAEGSDGFWYALLRRDGAPG